MASVCPLRNASSFGRGSQYRREEVRVAKQEILKCLPCIYMKHIEQAASRKRVRHVERTLAA
jgi:hypothetical protein